MQVSELNDVKVYNLSSGKSLPEWLSERKRRQLLKQDVDVRRRIELIQDFTMPTASTSIAVSKDRNYILASGVYKPRIKCYDVSQLSLKFERCFDSDAVRFEILSDDYSKIVLLQCDRYIEFHAQYGRYYRLRIPSFGRDLAYHYPSCDLFVVGTGPEIFRLNLEQGRFLQPYETDSSELNVCEINEIYDLLAVGTTEGRIECFDPRSKTRAGILDIRNSGVNCEVANQFPSVTALSFRNGLEMGIGLNSGHVLLYDIRSDKPILTKDHYNSLPIKRIAFHEKSDNVLSADSKVVKIWERETGKNLTAIEPDAKINDLCMFPDSGLMFLAAEAERMGIYYIPEIGQAPEWCSFLDNITEELEESDEVIMYDDYKFVTKQELESFGLSNLIGTNMLRAYMHGFFMDMRLYHQVKSVVDPFAYEKYRKEKIKSKIDEERSQRIKVKKLPKINRNLAEKILEDDNPKKSKKKGELSSILEDERFVAMFKNPDFQIDEESEEYKLLHPVISKHEKAKKKRQLTHINGDNTNKNIATDDEESSEDDTREMWREFRELKAKEKQELRRENQPKLYELKDGETYTSLSHIVGNRDNSKSSMTFSELLKNSEDNGIINEKGTALGSKEVTFKLKKSEKELKREEEAREHRLERKKIRRSAGTLTSGKRGAPKYRRGKK